MVPRPRMRRSRRGSRRRSGPGGSVRVAGCRRSAWPRSRGGICRLLSARTSPSCMPNRSGFCEIARRLGRDPSTISRELRRNASTRTYRLEYRASTAQWHVERRASRPKVSKLAANEQLREYVRDRLSGVITRADGGLVPGPDIRGSAAATAAARIGAGLDRGARSRSPTGWRSTSPMIPR